MAADESPSGDGGDAGRPPPGDVRGCPSTEGMVELDDLDLGAAVLSAVPAPPPTADEAAVARDLLGTAPTAETVADCLWSVVMLPEFQLVR